MKDQESNTCIARNRQTHHNPNFGGLQALLFNYWFTFCFPLVCGALMKI